MPRSRSASRGAFVPARKPELITSLGHMRSFLATVCSSQRLYIAFHGHRLSRQGDLSLIAVRAFPHPDIYVIDIQELGHEAFETRSVFGLTFHSVLENPVLRKVFWDVRDAADALWGQHGIRIQGVVDLQLFENASRESPRCQGWGRRGSVGGAGGRSLTYVQDLDAAMWHDLYLPSPERDYVTRLQKVMASRLPTTAFRLRPLDDDTIAFCANSIRYLPQLHTIYLDRITSEWIPKVKVETHRRVDAALGPRFDPQSPSKALGPWGDKGKAGALLR